MDNWYGMLTVETIEQVGGMILEMLQGKTYCFVSNYEYRGFVPETKVNQRLENGTNGSPLSLWYGKSGDYAGINFCDTYGVWGITTGTHSNQYDPSFKNPYIVIEYNQITISHRAPDGKIMFWQITIQE